MCAISREETAWRLEHAGEKKRGGEEKLKKLHVAVLYKKQEMKLCVGLKRAGRQAESSSNKA
jgi:hypothetical protein